MNTGNCLIRTDVDPELNFCPDYAYRNNMYRKKMGPSNLSGLDENLDKAELPVCINSCLTKCLILLPSYVCLHNCPSL